MYRTTITATTTSGRNMLLLYRQYSGGCFVRQRCFMNNNNNNSNITILLNRQICKLGSKQQQKQQQKQNFPNFLSRQLQRQHPLQLLCCRPSLWNHHHPLIRSINLKFQHPQKQLQTHTQQNHNNRFISSSRPILFANKKKPGWQHRKGHHQNNNSNNNNNNSKNQKGESTLHMYARLVGVPPSDLIFRDGRYIVPLEFDYPFLHFIPKIILPKIAVLVPNHHHKQNSFFEFIHLQGTKEYVVRILFGFVPLILMVHQFYDELVPYGCGLIHGPSMLPTMASNQSEIYIRTTNLHKRIYSLLHPIFIALQNILSNSNSNENHNHHHHDENKNERIVEENSYYQRGDIIGFIPPGSSSLSSSSRNVCKRIIGLPGDRVQRYGQYVHLYADEYPENWGIFFPTKQTQAQQKINTNTQPTTTETEQPPTTTETVVTNIVDEENNIETSDKDDNGASINGTTTALDIEQSGNDEDENDEWIDPSCPWDTYMVEDSENMDQQQQQQNYPILIPPMIGSLHAMAFQYPNIDQESYMHRTIVVPPGHVWVESDNPICGIDSRQYGPVPMESINCIFTYCIWPIWSSDTNKMSFTNKKKFYNRRIRPYPIPMNDETLKEYDVYIEKS